MTLNPVWSTTEPEPATIAVKTLCMTEFLDEMPSVTSRLSSTLV